MSNTSQTIVPKDCASATPQAMSFQSAVSMFEAVGIPITPWDDNHQKNTYPMVKVVAKDTVGNTLAEGHVVLPVSDEMTCVACHASGSQDAARPPVHGWLWDPRGPEKDYRRNILALHDDKQLEPERTVASYHLKDGDLLILSVQGGNAA